MAKKLVLMRHAKAAEGLNDFDRTLTKEGREQAMLIAERLMSEGIHPQIALVSAAKRAVETAGIVTEILGCPELIKREDELYDGGIRDYMRVLDAALHRVDSALVIAHNPALSDLCALLCDNWTKVMTPSAALGLEFEWE